MIFVDTVGFVLQFPQHTGSVEARLPPHGCVLSLLTLHACCVVTTLRVVETRSSSNKSARRGVIRNFSEGGFKGTMDGRDWFSVSAGPQGLHLVDTP